MAHLSRSLAEIEHQGCENVGEYEEYLPPPTSSPELIFDSLWTMAKEIWPEDIAKAEAWVKAQAVRYGIAEAKAQAASVAQSPITWVILGAGFWWLFSKKRR